MKVLSPFFVFLLFSCNLSGNKKEIQNHALSDKWTIDTLGCNQLRTKELALELISSNRLMNDTKEQFLNVFHTPDQITSTEDKEKLTYYFTSMCENGKLVAGSDLCYANFYFKENKLIETSFACE